MNISGTGAVAMEGDKTRSWLTMAPSTSVPQALLTRYDRYATQCQRHGRCGDREQRTINIFANNSFAFSVLGTVGMWLTTARW